MNIIAIETATPACALGIRTDSGREVIRVLSDGRRHTEALVPGMRALLDDVELAPRDITRVVVDRGPGLFTGLRVGIATAIGFAEGIGCELVGVTSLEMLARGAFDAGVRGVVVACVDGRRGEIFVQTFDVQHETVALDEARVAMASEVATTWRARGSPVTFTGDGVERYRSEFATNSKATLFDQVVPSLHAGISIGAERRPEEVVLPLYLREADAVANFGTRERPT